MDESYHTVSQWVGHVVSGAAIVGSLMGFLPVVGAGAALIWYIIQIKESETFRKWSARRRERKLAHLRAQIILIEESLRLEPPPTSTLPPTLPPADEP